MIWCLPMSSHNETPHSLRISQAVNFYSKKSKRERTGNKQTNKKPQSFATEALFNITDLILWKHIASCLVSFCCKAIMRCVFFSPASQHKMSFMIISPARCRCWGLAVRSAWYHSLSFSQRSDFLTIWSAKCDPYQAGCFATGWSKQVCLTEIWQRPD